MKQVFTFHETVRGHLHIQREIPCQDYSDSYSADNGKFHIAIVADGHGAEECYRSAKGAKLAVETAMQNLINFANTVLVSDEIENRFYKDIFSNPRYHKMTIKHLTDTIIAQWNDSVLEDYKMNPPTAEEAGEYLDQYSSDEEYPHIYGTTLIAGLWLPKCLILIQQGDGRCDVFYGDGSVDQPIPWDSRCEDNFTTSLCQEDAVTSIRNCVINLEEKNVVACYLGCDGIEDAYRDTYESFGGTHELMGGVHTFYKDLTCQLLTMTAEDFQEYLKNMLPEFSSNGRFSRSGSGDDVSVAGIVDLEAIQILKESFLIDVKKYSLEEDLFWKEDELRGKTRKHGILLKRKNEAKDKMDSLKVDLENLEDRQADLKQKREELVEEVNQAKEELDQLKKEADEETDAMKEDPSFNGPIRKSMRLLGLTLQEIYERIASGINQYENRYMKLLEQLSEIDNTIQNEQDNHQHLLADMKLAEESYETAKNSFDEYDTIYQKIDSEREKIVEMIQNLS